MISDKIFYDEINTCILNFFFFKLQNVQIRLYGEYYLLKRKIVYIRLRNIKFLFFNF